VESWSVPGRKSRPLQRLPLAARHNSGIEKDKAFTGATIDGWFALNLSSNLHTGLGQWTVDEIATYLKTCSYKGKTTPLGPMAEVVQNSTSHLTDADLQAMAEYLKSIPANSTLRTPRKLPDDKRLEIAALYLEHCSGCHQAQGRGIAGLFPPLAGNGVVLARDPANIIKVVLGGIPAQGKYAPMPSFASQLTDKGVADGANYVRTSWDNTASPNVTPAMVAKLRRASQARGPRSLQRKTVAASAGRGARKTWAE
jgi:mono/diheme cytochrome c family protein